MRTCTGIRARSCCSTSPTRTWRWDSGVKASDEFLDPLFQAYFARLGLPNLMAKKNYHELTDYVPDGEIDPEVGEKLDAIARVAEAASGGADGPGR